MKTQMLKTFLLVMLALVVCLPAQARKKPTYQITLKINHGQDTMMFMGCYYAKGNKVLDTAYRDKKGTFTFTGNGDTLTNGLYFFANERGNYVEFVVYKEKPFFDFETEHKDWTTNMHVKGSKQNQFFFDFHRQEGKITTEMARQRNLMDSAAFATFEREQYNRLDSLKAATVNAQPELFLSKMMSATREISVPVVDANGEKLSEYQRRDYYMEHYFDNLPLNDNSLIHTPRAVFYDRVMNYFDNVLKYAPPSTIVHYMDPFLDKCKPSPEIFQYMVMTLTQKYLQSKVMVYDSVYVHLVNKYYASDDNFWSSPSSIQSEVARATKWERLLVGHEAPELILYDTLRIPHSLHAMPYKWKLLVFWSPNCGHCKHIIPEVYRIFDQYSKQYNIGAFTILSDPDDKTRKEWREFLKSYSMNSPAWICLDGGEANCDWHDVYDIQSTPQIYLIDENNIIQAKRLGESNIESVIKAICGQ